MGRWFRARSQGLWMLLSTAGLVVCGPLHVARGQVVFNEVLAENGLSNADDEGDYEDWVELRNLGSAETRLLGYAMSDDPARPRRWLFPDVAIPPGGHLLVWLSGKDRFAPPPGDGTGADNAAAFRPKFIRIEDEWRYLVADPILEGPPAGWTRSDFDDGAWLVGRSGFGYGDGDDFTQLSGDTGAVFLRREFVIDDPASVSSLILRMDFDDGFVAFLNGVRVASEGAAQEVPTFQSTATIKREAGMPLLYDLAPYLSTLRMGQNVLAVAGLNNLPSSDMSILPELGIIPAFLHASFKLDNDGEQLLLIDASGAVADSISFPLQTRDHSYGRLPDGSGTWRYVLVPTPEAPNNGRAFDAPLPDGVLFSPDSGKHSGTVDLSLALNQPGPAEIRYTMDGSPPTASSAVYTGPLAITRDTALTAAGFLDGDPATPAVARSYFFGGAIELPVLSISMAPADYATVHNSENARGRLSEKPAYLEIFEAGFRPAAATPCGLRLHGGAGRGGDFATKKSYKCYFRGSYGKSRLEYPIIPDTFVDGFDKLVLRAGFNDAFRTNSRAAYIRDQLVRELHEDMGALASHGSWCSLYVNMKFRGLYNVVERIDDEFLKPYTGDGYWDVIKTGNEVLSGTIDEWVRLRNFLVQSDLSQETVYLQAEAMMDVENFTSYMILNIWAQNHDWISNNWYAARPRRPDGKWIFMSWDAEFGVGLIPAGSNADTFEFVFSRTGYIRDIFESLLKSPVYRAYFAEKADRHSYGALHPAQVLLRIDRLKLQVQADIPEELQPYGQPVSQWTANLAECMSFARSRGSSFLSSIFTSRRYAFPAVTTPRITACDPAKVVNTGGTRITLSGVRLHDNIVVSFNGIRAALVESAPLNRLKVTLPFDLTLEGYVTIQVADLASGTASSTASLLEVSLPRPLPVEVVPARGTSAGGDRVRIAGAGFLRGVAVRFGGVLAPEVSIAGGEPQALEVVTPPGSGVVDVQVFNNVPGGVVPARATFSFTYLEQHFLRGDANGDGVLDISDAVAFLESLFLGGGPLECEDAADSNDSGALDLSDAIFTLSFLFQGGRDPSPPFPLCGHDPTSDVLACEMLRRCAE